ncbi:methyl-accepting chemotaxis protein [Algihabitans albus]|uniref:methyl-accepting chemotaxis protein n=1 Tax=Algihabitans albus TaxID=2164067 RepID=UPI000E5C84CE|nr:nitrate- and nitrite sensing domain-containing protein [Algihabitans albus]
MQFKSSSMAWQLNGLVALPLLTALLLGLILGYQQLQVLHSSKLSISAIEVAEASNALVHQLQRERGRSVGFLSSDERERVSEALNAQRSETDRAVAAFDVVLTRNPPAELLSARAADFVTSRKLVDEALGLRARVDAGDASVGNVLSGYTTAVEGLIDTIGFAVEVSQSTEVTENLLAYLALVKAVENAGLERALGSRVFDLIGRHEFDASLYNSYLVRLAGERAYLRDFLAFAKPEFREHFKSTVVGADVDQVIAWREILTTLPQTLDGQGVRGVEWFDTATSRIDLIVEVENWIAAQTLDVAQAKAQSARLRLIAVAAGLLALTLGGAWITRRQTSRMVKAVDFVSDRLQSLASGDLDLDLTQPDQALQSTETLQMHTGLIELRKSAQAQRRLQQEKLEAAEAEAARAGTLRSIVSEFRGEFESVLSRLTQGTSALSDSAVRLTDGASGTQHRSSTASLEASRSTEAAESVAGAAEKIASSIGEVSRQAQSMRGQAATVSQESGEIAEHFAGLKSMGDEIRSVMDLISRIADQTTLLALNATIESARAGEAGKGFAVVASEVKSLAVQTGSSTENIRAKVEAMVAAIDRSAASIERVSSAIDGLDSQVGIVTTAVDEQLVTADDISQSAAHAAAGTKAASTNVQEVEAIATETNKEASSVRQTVGDLSALVETLEAQTRGFLERIMAA